jgi:hypothetical protein
MEWNLESPQRNHEHNIKTDVKVKTELIWLKLGTRGEVIQRRQRTLRSTKIW